MEVKERAHRTHEEVRVSPTGQEGYEYSDGGWRYPGGAIMVPAPHTALTPLNANRFQKASVQSRLNKGRNAALAALVEKFGNGQPITWEEGYKNVALALLDLFMDPDVSPAVKVRIATEFRAMSGLSQAESGEVAGGSGPGLMLDDSALALLGRALMAYEGERMAVDVDSHDVVVDNPDE